MEAESSEDAQSAATTPATSPFLRHVLSQPNVRIALACFNHTQYYGFEIGSFSNVVVITPAMEKTYVCMIQLFTNHCATILTGSRIFSGKQTCIEVEERGGGGGGVQWEKMNSA